VIPLDRSTLTPAAEALRVKWARRPTGRGKARATSARAAWSDAKALRRHLKGELESLAFRAEFCMYCYESRGTDVDHFEPISANARRVFDWTNHILACGFCNQQAKREEFPRQNGVPLLLDPFVDDSAHHMTLGPSGAFVDLTDHGAETIRLLRLNNRAQLVRARAVSWRTVLTAFDGAAREARPLSPDDIETLRMLPVVDAFHHFAHDVAANRLKQKAVPNPVIAAADREIAQLRNLFPHCGL
jgi:uncharacterized protein (TIGR02646 family)